MAELAFFLAVLLFKIVIVTLGVIAIVVTFVVSAPIAILWPVPQGMTWRDAVRARMWRATKFMWNATEVILTALET